MGRLLFGKGPLTLKYGYSEQAAASVPAALVASLTVFKDQLQAQKAAGSPYLIGDSLSALDIYFATASIMLVPPGPEIIPRTKENGGLMKAFAKNPPEVQSLLESSNWLTEYRDHIYKKHLVTPAVLGGTPT